MVFVRFSKTNVGVLGRMKNGPIFHPGTISRLPVPRRRQNATLGTDLPISVPGAAARLSFRQRCEPIMMKID